MSEWIYEFYKDTDGIQMFRSKEEIIRCKDCKHYNSDGGALMECGLSQMVVDDADYCSYGEREDE